MSFPRYPAYKPSGVEWLGEVPEHWEIKRVRRIFEIKKRIAGELGFDILSITQQGIKVRDPESNDGQLSMDYSKYQVVEPGDFAMNHMDLLTGYVDISRILGVTSPDYRVFSMVESCNSDPGYLLYVFQMGYRQKILYAYGQGSSQLGRWRLPTKEFQDWAIPFPSQAEQAAVATFLDRETAKIDALIAEQQRLIERLQEKRQAVISHAVTKGLNPDAPMKDSGVEWLGDVPEHWEVCRVKAVSVFTTSGPRGWSERVGEAGALFVQSGDLTDVMGVNFENCKRVQVGDDAETARTKLQDGDLVVCITGAKTGNVAVCESVPETSYVNQHLCLIRPGERVYPRFLGTLLKSFCGQIYFSLAQYGLKQGLSLEDVREAPVILPPQDEQHEIIQWLMDVSSHYLPLEAASRRTISLLQERRSALISAAVTGQIDVRGLVAEASAA